MSDLKPIEEWINKELGIKVNKSELSSLLQGKSGQLYSQYFSFLIRHAKSERNGQKVKSYLELINRNQQLEQIENNIKDLNEKVAQMNSNLKPKVFKYKENYLLNQKGQMRQSENRYFYNILDLFSSRSDSPTNFEVDYSQFEVIKNKVSETSIDFNDLRSKIESNKVTLEEDKASLVKKSQLEIFQLMELVNESLSEITESKTDDDTSVNLDEEGIINMLQTAPRIDYLENKSRDENGFSSLQKLMDLKRSVQDLEDNYAKQRAEQYDNLKTKVQHTIKLCSQLKTA